MGARDVRHLAQTRFCIHGRLIAAGNLAAVKVGGHALCTAEVQEVMCVALGRVDSYDFHALEVIQCMAERRRGARRCGVVWMQAMRGDAVWRSLVGRVVQRGRLEPATVRGVSVPQPNVDPAGDLQPSISDGAAKFATG